MGPGPPFASTGAAGLTTLAVWLLQLGIRLERIAPGKPQQNGRHERMHRTLQLETDSQRDIRSQERAYDLWRREFNDERPHAALKNRPPAKVYIPSSRAYPCRPITPEPAAWNRAERVDKEGFIKLHRKKFFVSSALRLLFVELERVSADAWDVRWGPILLGRIHWDSPDRSLVVIRRKRGEVSTVSLE